MANKSCLISLKAHHAIVQTSYGQQTQSELTLKACFSAALGPNTESVYKLWAFWADGNAHIQKHVHQHRYTHLHVYASKKKHTHLDVHIKMHTCA